MANIKSAQKAQRQSIKRAARNKSVKSAIRTYEKKATLSVGEGGENAASAVLQAVSALDRAAQKGVIHANNAARRKSRLMSRLHQLSISTAVEVAPVTSAPAKGSGRKSAVKRRTTSSTTSTKGGAQARVASALRTAATQSDAGGKATRARRTRAEATPPTEAPAE